MPTPTRSDPAANTLRILWMAGLSAPLLYLVLGWVLSRSVAPVGRADAMHPAPDRASGAPMALVGLLGGVALLQTVLMLPLRQRLAALVQFDPLRFFVVRFAMAESIAAFGLVLFLLGRSWVALIAFVGWALALMVLIRPLADDAAQLRDWSRGR